jgi:hypothetical protein
MTPVQAFLLAYVVDTLILGWLISRDMGGGL